MSQKNVITIGPSATASGAMAAIRMRNCTGPANCVSGNAAWRIQAARLYALRLLSNAARR